MSDEMPQWIPIVFVTDCIINGRMASMTIRGYGRGEVWHWVAQVDDGYCSKFAVPGTEISSFEAKEAAEAAAIELLAQ